MERLKVGLNALNVIPDFTFTFQYGEIKSFNADKFASGICKFTFQYGEIKSLTVPAVVIMMSRFTFQYGEIKSVPQLKDELCCLLFTFQYGEIKRSVGGADDFILNFMAAPQHRVVAL